MNVERSKQAIDELIALGADVRYRDEAGGTGKVIVSTDGKWRGGDAGLAHLKHVIGLYKLQLAGHITNAGLIELKSICGLTSLDLHIVGITDVGVRELSSLTKLRRLNLTYTKVTDEGIASLSELTQLEWLGLSYTRVTQAGIGSLRQSLVDTTIEGNPSR